MITVYYDHLKQGESRPADQGPWCFHISRNGHVTKIETGFHTKEEAEEAAKAYDEA